MTSFVVMITSAVVERKRENTTAQFSSLSFDDVIIRHADVILFLSVRFKKPATRSTTRLQRISLRFIPTPTPFSRATM